MTGARVDAHNRPCNDLGPAVVRLKRNNQDREAWAVVWRCALSVARYRTYDGPTAEDVAQNAQIKIFKALGNCREDDNPGGWAYRIIQNACNADNREQIKHADVRSLEHTDGGEDRAFQAVVDGDDLRPDVAGWLTADERAVLLVDSGIVPAVALKKRLVEMGNLDRVEAAVLDLCTHDRLPPMKKIVAAVIFGNRLGPDSGDSRLQSMQVRAAVGDIVSNLTSDELVALISEATTERFVENASVEILMSYLTGTPEHRRSQINDKTWGMNMELLLSLYGFMAASLLCRDEIRVHVNAVSLEADTCGWCVSRNWPSGYGKVFKAAFGPEGHLNDGGDFWHRIRFRILVASTAEGSDVETISFKELYSVERAIRLSTDLRVAGPALQKIAANRAVATSVIGVMDTDSSTRALRSQFDDLFRSDDDGALSLLESLQSAAADELDPLVAVAALCADSPVIAEALCLVGEEENR